MPAVTPAAAADGSVEAGLLTILLAVAVALIVGEIWDIDVQQEVSDFLTSSVWSREEPAPGSAQAVIWQLEA